MTGAPTPGQVIARRHRERDVLVDAARVYVQRIDAAVDVVAAVIFGSVARGDFHRGSDVDVLVVGSGLPTDYRDRLRALGWPPPARVKPVVWTPQEYVSKLARRDPAAMEAAAVGVWLRGNPARLQEPAR